MSQFIKGHNSVKKGSKVPKLELDLQLFKRKPYKKKFRFLTSSRAKKKSRKLNVNMKGNNSVKSWSSVTKLKLGL
jgi:hypothetical protein